MFSVYCYIGLVIVLIAVIVWCLNILYKEVHEYREAMKVATKALDFCEYFDKTQRIVASIADGRGRRTIVGTAKFSENGKLFAICTDDREYISSEVLSERTIKAIEEKESERGE